MRTIEEIAASVSMDTNSFKSMLEVFNRSPAFFGGALELAFLEANEIEEVQHIPLTAEWFRSNIGLINNRLDGYGVELIDHRDSQAIMNLCEFHIDAAEAALAQYIETYGDSNIDGYYFPSTDELIEFLRHNISIEE